MIRKNNKGEKMIKEKMTYKCYMNYEVIVHAKNEKEAHEIAEKELAFSYGHHDELMSLLTVKKINGN